MSEKPTNGMIERMNALLRYFSRQKIGIHAAGAGYFIVLSLFPLLVLLLALLRYTGLQVETLTDLVSGFLPEALLPAAKRLIVSTYRNTSGAIISLSAFTGLWSASRGVYGLLTGLNAIYGVAEDRGFFHTRLISVGYTFLLLLVLLLSLTLHVFGATLLEMLPRWNLSLPPILTELGEKRGFLLLPVQSLVFALMFAFLPNGRNKFRDTLPGALLASFGWLLFSDAYSVYVERFAKLSNIYGSVYAVALSMLWLYCCLSILFYGGALNQYLEDHR